MNCVAVLLTKAKTKFFIEFHSSCLESEITTFDLFSGVFSFARLKMTLMVSFDFSGREYED